MREDMFKVIVERPRRRSTKRVLPSVIRLRDDLDGPARLGMRMGYDYRELNENLVPLRRYLEAQVGRPWNKVFGEICERIHRRNTVQQHVHQHVRDFIAVDVAWRDGKLVDLSRPYSWAPWTIHQELYVDPDTGLVRRNKGAGNWRRSYQQRLQAEQAEIHGRRRVISADTQLLLVAGLWFGVVVEKLPAAIVTHAIVKGRHLRQVRAEPRYDVVLRKLVSRERGEEERVFLYGAADLFATNKRQLSRRELKEHGLSSSQAKERQ
jgi:hypothetical protein